MVSKILSDYVYMVHPWAKLQKSCTNVIPK